MIIVFLFSQWFFLMFSGVEKGCIGNKRVELEILRLKFKHIVIIYTYCNNKIYSYIWKGQQGPLAQRTWNDIEFYSHTKDDENALLQKPYKVKLYQTILKSTWKRFIDMREMWP